MRCIKYFVLGLLLSSCTNSERIYRNVQSIPTISSTSLDNMMDCAREIVGDEIKDTPHAYAIYIRDVSDGTTRAPTDGPLSDAGRIQLAASLFKLHPTQNQMAIMDNFPSFFDKNDRLTPYGVVDPEAIELINSNLTNMINNTIRKYVDLPPLPGMIVYVIDAAFTRFDNEGNSFGYATSANYDRNTSSDIEFSSNNEEKYMSLVVTINSPQMNAVVDAESFDIVINKNKKLNGFTISRNGLGVGLSTESLNIESPYSAQKTLIDYAALWIMDVISAKGIIEQCSRVR